MATTRKLIVEVVDARNLLPKDGHGSSSPYVQVDYYGQRKRTNTVPRDINPTWNEVLEFNVGKPSNVFEDIVELHVYHDKNYGPTRRNNFLGQIRLSSSQFVHKGEEALIYFPLEKKYLLSWISGDIGLKVYYVDAVVPPPAPPAPPAPAPPQVVEEAKPSVPPETQQPSESESKPAEDVAKEVEKADQEPKPEEAAPAEPPPSEGEKASEEPPAPATAETELPLPKETEPTPTAAAAEETEEAVLEPKDRIETMSAAASVSKPLPDVRFAGINGPQPIKRGLSFASDVSSESMTIERSSFDLVEKMHYLFVRVVKARGLPTNGRPVVKISVSNYHVRSKPARKTAFFEWDQTFAFNRESPDSSSILEVSVWDPPNQDPASDVAGLNFLGGICFDVTEIPLRDPPDSPLAPQWYRLEEGGAHNGHLMLATWLGTQADESFPDAWKTDTAGNPKSKSKVYQSPKLWYLRATVVEAQDVLPITTSLKEVTFQVKAQLGTQIFKTKTSVTGTGTPSWNEDLLFVAAEPFSDQLIFTVDIRQPKGPLSIGLARIPLTAIERRVDDRKVASRWVSLDDPNEKKRAYRGRLHLQLCFDGGYHVMDEAAHLCSDYRPTARQLWKPPVGTVELGIIGCKNLIPLKTVNGKGCTDAYCVAKYGPKWVRTRTVTDRMDPKWNEQYTFKVYDPCTVLTIGVFDSSDVFETDGSKGATHSDLRIGKVRIRISTLGTGKVYRNTYPLFMLSNMGMKKMGEVEIAIRFVRMSPTLDLLHVYSQSLLPLMHHVKPLGMAQQDVLRKTTVNIVAAHLSRSEPPLRREVVLYMLDADSQSFSMRKVRANWCRIINVIAGVIDIARWVDNTRSWKNPTATILVHALLVMLVWFPDLIVPSLAFYVFVIGAWNYRFRSRDPLPHFDPKLSLADTVDREELDEEFDTVPSSRSADVVKMRYDKLRAVGMRVQTMLGYFATQGERVQALVTWRDPRATGIFVGLCFIVAMILYLVPSKMVAMAFGFYYLRHPIFRDRMPSPALNFFRRLPSLTDRIM
nr:FT-interacting protein 7 isoform X2 [Ziziphus jujuba var. spinosa]XP_048334032.1 FT-interacting protein 7 isoform X3 [Ziziphus jujuba var. spinosa]XP_048334033.1 FT-interacting protein 7 isoform X4 [Ziziphus jujuba var. spinosa]